MADKTVNIWIATEPYSADPVEYDLSAHHYIFRSVLGSLVTQYRSGELLGELAESWSPTNDYKTWRFKIRKNIQFSNGDQITPEVIASSFLRICFLLKQKHSIGGFAEHLLEYENLTTPTTHIKGIEYNQNDVIFQFKEGLPRLLETISFGLYSIAHPSNYDHSTGKWKNARSAISSGSYSIKSWSAKAVELELRDDFLPKNRHPAPLKHVVFTWDSNARTDADIVAGSSRDQEFVNRQFHGAVASSIIYAECHSWTHPNSVCKDIETRRALRSAFYLALRRHHFVPTISFFPLALPGIKEFEQTEVTKFRNPTTSGTLRYRIPTVRITPFEIFGESITEASASIGISAEKLTIPMQQVLRENDPHLAHYSFDISLRGTSILVEDPMADIKFMFLSKEGIRLPDTDGRILAELRKDRFDPQIVNQLLWEQAVVWPVGHFSDGLWARPEFDFSMINLTLPATELQWIGWQQ